MEGSEMTLATVNHKIGEALTAAGYIDQSYYSIPGGFVIATALEPFGDDGTRLRDKPQLEPVAGTSWLRSYLKALFKAKPGHYRVVCFAVSPVSTVSSKIHISQEDAEALVTSGATGLPRDIGQTKLSEDYRCTALIYEFEKDPNKNTAEPRVPGFLHASDHLAKSGIAAAFQALLPK